MIFFLISVLLFKIVESQTQECFLFRKSSSLCLSCLSDYYSTIPWSSDNAGFDKSNCKLKKTSSFLKEIYVSPKGCSEPLLCDGSLERPFSDLRVALSAGQSAIESYKQSNLTIYLLADPNGAENVFFVNNNGKETFRYHFRRVGVNITIKALMCSAQVIAGCYSQESARPTVYIRTEQFYLFITSILTIENVIFDGSEIRKEFDQPLSPEMNKTRFCSEGDLYRTESDEKYGPCSLIGRKSNNTKLGYSLLNIEPIFECTTCLQNNIALFIRNCDFRLFHSFNEGPASLKSLISVLRLKFNINITNSTFKKMSLPDGIFTSIDFDLLKEYGDVSEIFAKASLDLKFNQYYDDFVNFTNCSISEYNNFEVQYSNYKPSIISIEETNAYIRIRDCIFFQNRGQNGLISSFISAFVGPTKDLFTRVYFAYSNIIANLRMNLMNFTRIAPYRNSRYQVLSGYNTIIGHKYGGGIISTMVDIIVVENQVINVEIDELPFLYINVGRLFIDRSLFKNISTSARGTYMVEFRGPKIETEESIFDPPTNNLPRNLVVDSVLVTITDFISCKCGIFYETYVYNYFEMDNCNVIDTGREDSYFMKGMVEVEFDLFDNVFENILASTVFQISFCRDNHWWRNRFYNMSLKGFAFTKYYSILSPFGYHTNILNTFVQIKLEKYLFYHDGFLVKSRSVTNISGSYFENIINPNNILNTAIITTSILQVSNITNCTFIAICNLTIIKYSGGSLSTIAGDFTISNCSFIQRSELKYDFRFVMYLTQLRNVIIKNCFFKGTPSLSFINKAIINIYSTYNVTYNSRYFLTNSTFQDFVCRGGVFYFQGFYATNLLIKSCSFINNTSTEVAADIFIETKFKGSDFSSYFQMRKYANEFHGIRDCFFASSRGYEGGSIYVSQNSQLLIQRNIFIDIYSVLKGAISVNEFSQVFLDKIRVDNSVSTEEGGVIASLKSEMIIQDSQFSKISSSFGGALVFRYSTITILYCSFSNVNATQGAVGYSISTNLYIKFTDIFNTRADVKCGLICIYGGVVDIQDSYSSYSWTAGLASVFYIESPKYLIIERFTFQNSFAKLDAAIYILNSGSAGNRLYDIICKNSSALNGGDCLLVIDSKIDIQKFLVKDIVSQVSVFQFQRSTFNSILRLENVVIENVRYSLQIFKISGTQILMVNTVFKSNAPAQSCFSTLRITSSSVELQFLNFYNQENQFLNGQFLIAEDSIFKADHLVLKLQKSSAGLLFQNCSIISLIRATINQAFASDCYQGKGGAFNIKRSNFFLLESSISKGKGQNGSAIYSIDSNLTLIGALIINQEQKASSEAVIYSITSENLNEINMHSYNTSIISHQGVAIYAQGLNKIHIDKSNFAQFFNGASVDSTQCLIAEESKQIFIIQSKLRGFQYKSAITLHSLSTNTTFQFIYSEVLNCYSSTSGGAIFIEGSISSSIFESFFSNIESAESGGVIAINCPNEGQCPLKLENNTIQNTKAGKYGAIYFSSHKVANLSDSNRLSNNIALYLNKQSKTLSTLVESLPSEIVFLKDYPADINKARERFLLRGLSDEDIMSEIDKVASGQAFQLVAMLTNEKRHLFSLENEGKSKISILNQTKTPFVMNSDAKIKNGFIIYESITFISNPGEPTEVSLYFSLPQLNFSLENKITLNIRKCIRGEILSGISCQKCPKDYYSLSYDPSSQGVLSCDICPVTADCPEGDQLNPIAGFWRKNENESKIVRCPISDACPGGSTTNTAVTAFKPLCSKGFRGPRCSICEPSYGMNAENVCLKCSETPTHFLKFVLLTLFSLGIIIYQSESSLKITVDSSKSRCLMKILIDHWSYVSFISSYKINWDGNVFNIINVADNYISASPGEMFNFDCFLSLFIEHENKFLINNILIATSPIFYSVLCFILLLLYKKIKKFLLENYKKFKKQPEPLKSATVIVKNTEEEQIQNAQKPSEKNVGETNIADENKGETNIAGENKGETNIADENKAENITTDKTFKKRILIVAMLIIIFYNFYSRLILNASKFWHCISFDETEDVYMDSNNEILCWSRTHLYYIIFISFGIIGIWGISAPFLIFMLTKKLSTSKLIEKDNYAKKLHEFITLDFKAQYYYWDLITYFSKFLIVFLKIVTSSLETASQGAIVILLFLVLFLVQERYKPYEYPFVNNLKTLSYMTTICSMAFIIMASTEAAESYNIRVFIAISIFSTGIFYLFWIKQFFELKKEVLIEKINKIRKKSVLTTEGGKL